MRLARCRATVAVAVAVLVLAAAHAIAACPSAPEARLTLPATAAALTAGDKITIVAFGSSSTQGVGASRSDRTYPARLQAYLRTAWPRASVTVLNRGIGGEQTDDMLARMDRDVLAARPTLVIWQDGANEAVRGMKPALFRSLLDQGVRRLITAGADVVLMDNQDSPRIEQAANHAVYVDLVAREGAARGASVFSRWALMEAWRQTDPAGGPMVGPDGMHQTDRGYACLAAALARSIEDAVARPAVETADGTPAGGVARVARRNVTAR